MTTRFRGTKTDEPAVEIIRASGSTEPALAVSGDVSLRNGGALEVGGDVGFHGVAAVAQQANITDASTAHALSAVFSDTEVETALNNLGTKINSILAVLEAYGLTAGA